MDIRSQKQSLRRAMIDRILALDPDDRRGQEAALADRFAVLPGFEEARTVLLYVSAFPEEIATGPMLLGTLGPGQEAGLPPGRSRREAAPALRGDRPRVGPEPRDTGDPRAAPPLPRGRSRRRGLGARSPAWRSTTGATASAGARGITTGSCRPSGPMPPLGAGVRLPVGRGAPGRAARRAPRRDRLAPHWGDSPGDHEGSSGGGSRRAPTAGLITELGPRASGAWRTSGRLLGGRPRRCRLMWRMTR